MKDLESIKQFMMDDEDEDLLEADLKTVLVVTGSYLYSGAELTDVEDSVYARILELTTEYLVDEPKRIPKNATIH